MTDKPTPDQIIAAFDECLDFVYGRRWGRDYRHKSDVETAQRWVAAGITIPIASIVFYQRMTYMHEKWMGNHDLSDRSKIPHSLKLFDENIEAAIRRVAAGGAEVDMWEQAQSQWRARISFWLKKPESWRVEMWGEPPGHSDCRAPHSLLAELLKKKE